MKNHTLPLFAAFVAGALMLPAASTAVADSQTLAQAEQSNHPDRHGPPGKVRPHRHKAGSASDSAATPGQAKHTSQQHGAPGKRKTNPHPAAGKGAEASNPAAVEHGSDEAKRPKPRRPKGAAGKTPQRR